MKGYKVTDENGKCRGFQFEVGKTYTQKGKLVICKNGFHFCEKVADCFSYYDFSSTNRIFEVETVGGTITEGNKTVCSDIKIIKELSWVEMLDIANAGRGNTGLNNSGHRNSGDRNNGDRNNGDRNSGHRNSGYRNSGYSNSGDRNSGYSNSGDRNSGDRNSGYRNSGDRNSGYRNSGDSNSGYSNSGYRNSGVFNKASFSTGAFCTGESKVLIFDKPSNMTTNDILSSKWFLMLNWICEPTQWINESNMTEEEKKQNPKHETLGGYLKVLGYQEAWKIGWSKMTDEEKKYIVENVPNFDAKKFKYITGIEV
jgi:hypothetical protein